MIRSSDKQMIVTFHYNSKHQVYIVQLIKCHDIKELTNRQATTNIL